MIDWCLTSSKQFFSYIQDETVTWRVSLVEHELFTLPQHLSSPRCFVGSCCSVFSFLCILFSGHPGISVNELSPLSLRRWNIRHFKFDFHHLKMADSLLLEEVTLPRKRELFCGSLFTYRVFLLSLELSALRRFTDSDHPFWYLQIFLTKQEYKTLVIVSILKFMSECCLMLSGQLHVSYIMVRTS